MVQATTNQPPNKKWLIYKSLEAEPREEDGSVKWDKPVMHRALAAINGKNTVDVQTLMYEMEAMGYISRTRKQDGRSIGKVFLVNEPPVVSYEKPDHKAFSNGHAEKKFDLNKISTAIEEITPAIAAEILGKNVHNRNIRDGYVARLAGAMERREWVTNGESIKIAHDGTLLDGQHRLMAVVHSGVTIKTLVIRGLPLSTQETLDTGVKRTLGDILKLRGETHPKDLAATLVQIYQWKRYGKMGLAGAFYPTNQQAIAVLDAHPEARQAAAIGEYVSNRIRYPAALAGGLYWVFNQIDSDDANDFFEKFATGARLDDESPILLLRKTVTEMGIVGAAERLRMIVFAIKAWNAYRNGQTPARLRWAAGGSKPEPFPKPV